MERGDKVQSAEPKFLLVAECGGQWAHWVEDLDLRNGALMVLAQAHNEKPKVFSARVRSRVTNEAFDRVALICGPNHDQCSLALRINMVRSAVAGMSARGGGQVLLVGTGKTRLPLEALANTLTDMLQGSGVEVRAADDITAQAA